MSTLALEILNEKPCQTYVAGTNGNTIKIYVHAWGLFPTSGWINPKLVLREPRPGTEPPPADSFAELDFYADPPPQASVILDTLTPTLVEAVIELPWVVHGVRVHGKKNSQETLVRFSTAPSSGDPVSNKDDFVPIPWLVVRGGGDLGG